MNIYNSKQVSDKTGISLRTIQRMAEAGKIGQKPGHDYVYFDEDIENLKAKENISDKDLTNH